MLPKKLETMSPDHVPWFPTPPVLTTLPVQLAPILLAIPPALLSTLPIQVAPVLSLIEPTLVTTLPVHTPGVLLLIVPVLLLTSVFLAVLLLFVPVKAVPPAPA